MIKSVQEQQGSLVISLEGTLEIAKQARLKEELLRHMSAEMHRVVIDLSQVDFIDSSCLGVLIALTKKIRERGGDVCLCCLQDEVRSIFQITRLEKIFRIYSTSQEALAGSQ